MRARPGALQVGSFRGVPIRVHVSLLVALPLLALSFGGALQRAAETADVPPGALGGHPWAWGLAVAVGLFVSVLLHEMAHTFYALRHGGEVRGITLMIVGGVSELAEVPKRPRDEALMALVGPLTSLGLAAFLGVLTWLVHGLGMFQVQFALFTLAMLNAVLGGFNLLPAFPMDGGRIVRAALTPRLGMVRATKVAAGLGRVFAVLFGVWGLVTLNPFTLVVAFFVLMGAEGESRQVRMKALLERVNVEALMTPRMVGVDLDLSMQDAHWALRHEHVSMLPVTSAGRPVGRVTWAAVQAVPEAQRGSYVVRDAMEDGVVADLREDGWTALRRMAEARVPMAAVVDEDGLLAGTLDWNDIQRGLARAEEAERNRSRTGWPRERTA
ncbi:site-2 protease family protein [Corallococcus sp. AB032C]|uniref:site-2 protease family protein n=1 Tax=Corallococcus sp. AB032C TaxID=2316717 RepID=UPI000EBABABB|nr:site-2 protease family protein [Corallococcus sp. AB032C]RKH79784.1 site-2 protease family protein [Corallococcus sp. AB032C]